MRSCFLRRSVSYSFTLNIYARNYTTISRPIASRIVASVADTFNCPSRFTLARRPFPEKLPLDVQDDPEEVVPGVRSHLLRALRSDLRFGDRR
jgi:hypothetical protein